MEINRCIMCGADMRLISSVKRPRKNYKVRTYKCEFCEYTDRVYGDGVKDRINTIEALEESGIDVTSGQNDDVNTKIWDNGILTASDICKIKNTDK